VSNGSSLLVWIIAQGGGGVGEIDSRRMVVVVPL